MGPARPNLIHGDRSRTLNLAELPEVVIKLITARLDGQSLAHLAVLHYYTRVLSNKTDPSVHKPSPVVLGNSAFGPSPTDGPRPRKRPSLSNAFNEKFGALMPVLAPLIRTLVYRQVVVRGLALQDLTPMGNLYTRTASLRENPELGRRIMRPDYPYYNEEMDEHVVGLVDIQNPVTYEQYMPIRFDVGRPLPLALYDALPTIRALNWRAHRIPLTRVALPRLRAARSAVGFALVTGQIDFLAELAGFWADRFARKAWYRNAPIEFEQLFFGLSAGMVYYFGPKQELSILYYDS
ncbi:hypothetical protein IWQ60_000642 [Tieghemiomyces parasiticus]|uniref:Uncharacterized protein n=1 Tax=Tieghemiomyces parasiticus TaxID=78921 RepID=A0A9W8AFN3_9FUNG|nr:hypothetical protein IWQ60_000642 [Tieghemiomyces parasiticus]